MGNTKGQLGYNSTIIARLVGNLTAHHCMEIVIVGLTALHLFPLKVLSSLHLWDVFLAAATSGLHTWAQISVKLLLLQCLIAI